MEKLIDLLNEFEKEIHQLGDVPPFEWNKLRVKYRRNKVQIISKEYGFIQWLVDNDKIEFGMPIETLSFREYYDVKKSDFLIALLSIQEEPIQFLCGLLK